MPATLLADIIGMVSDPDGNPVSGAYVNLYEELYPYTGYHSYTDEDGVFSISFQPVFAEDENPQPFTLMQNYPNPFNPSTTIPFTLDTAGHVSLTVFNISGQKIRTLIDDFRSKGLHTVIWDGRDNVGRNVGTGIYFYRLQRNDMVDMRKMLLIDGGNGISSGTVQPAAVEKSW